MEIKNKKIIIISSIIVFIIAFIVIFISIYNKDSNKNSPSKLSNTETKTTKTNSQKEIKSVTSLNNFIYWSEKVNISQLIEKTPDNSQKAFLYSFIWDYKNVEKISKDSPLQNTSISISNHYPTDLSGNILKNTTLTIDGKTVWNLKANMNLDLYNNLVHRIKISKKWYLDFYKKIVTWNLTNNNFEVIPKLVPASSVLKTSLDKEITYSTTNFKFKISPNTFVDESWNYVNDNLEIYFFDIDSSYWDINALNLDTFSQNDYKYYGWQMVTHWMPLIKAYLWDKELQIKNPIIWLWKIQNTDKAVNIDLANVEKNVYLKIDELSKYNIPAFWHLDQNLWIWVSSEMKILDSLWNYEFKLF